MRVISFKILRDFIDREPKAEVPIRIFYKKLTRANWENFSDMKETFNDVSAVGNKRFVFDLAGNHFRVVAKVLFNAKMVYIRFVGTHKEYDKINNIKNS